MRGRKPQSPLLTELNRVRPGGNRTKYIHTLQPLLDPPSHLTESEKELFLEITQNAPTGLLARIDQPLLAAFVQHVDIHRRAVRELNQLTFESQTGQRRKHPLVAIADAQAKLLIAMAESLGLTASARQRIRLPNKPAADAWDDAG